jgi:hypothetical protein
MSDGNPLAGRGRQVAVTVAALFFVSLAFPVVASLSDVAKYPWIGAADVIVAGILVAAGLLFHTQVQSQITLEDTARGYDLARLLAFVGLFLMAVFLVLPNAINWSVLLVGLAWRCWLLVYVFPAWLAHGRMG